MYEQILYEVQDPMALITLNRPDQMNAWTSQMATELRDAIHRAEADPAVVATVITGAGRGFCAGADLKTLSTITNRDAAASEVAPTDFGAGPETEAGEFDGTFSYLMATTKPIIAAINGAVAGMAVPFILSCDLRYMSEDAVILTAFSQRGLIAEWGLSWLLPRLVGPAVALDMLFSSRKVAGEEAERVGLVNKSVPAEELLPTVQAYVQHLADTCSPTSFAIMKRQVYGQLHPGLEAADRDSQRLMAESFNRPDFVEGVQSFLDRRNPIFERLPQQEK